MSNPYRSYDDLDITRVFLYIGDHYYIDRGKLAEKAEIGEGAVRSILTTLSGSGICSLEKKGVTLTETGYTVYRYFRDNLTPFKDVKNSILQDGFNEYVSVLHSYEKERTVHIYKARDYGIRQGCMGAMILMDTGKHINIPGIRKYNFDYIANDIPSNEGDLILVTSATSRRQAERGILAIALYLNDLLAAYHNFINFYHRSTSYTP